MIPSLSNKAVISEYFIFIFFILFSEYFIIFYFLEVTAGPFRRIFNDLTYTYWLDQDRKSLKKFRSTPY